MTELTDRSITDPRINICHIQNSKWRESSEEIVGRGVDKFNRITRLFKPLGEVHKKLLPLSNSWNGLEASYGHSGESSNVEPWSSMKETGWGGWGWEDKGLFFPPLVSSWCHLCQIQMETRGQGSLLTSSIEVSLLKQRAKQARMENKCGGKSGGACR